jgi:hypothetical protein
LREWIKSESQSTRYYIWRTQGDDKVRASHATNDGQVFEWTNPPTTGNPGEDYNCRCLAEPIDKTIVTEESRTRVTIYRPDGSKETRVGGSRSWRNNNPGNIRSGSFATSQGAVGKAGGFAVFQSAADGRRASVELLKTRAYRDLTIDQAIARRSPANENNTRQLQRDIRDITGLSGKEVVGKLNEKELDKLAGAIQRTEGWIEGTTELSRPSQ